jgi:TonB-dependent SusC/RagA subfamily outer membrane receptor
MMRTGLIILFLFAIVATGEVNGQKHVKKVFVIGTVIDAEKKPVSGAVILTDGKQTNSVTDSKGYFKIKIRPDTKKIMACHQAIGAGEIAFEGQSEVTITVDKKTPIPMDVHFSDPDEDMVNIGYGTASKKELSSSASSIDTRKSRYSSYTDIYEMIKGEFPGVQVTGHSILIRGISSINSGTEPLFVVDGMVVNSIEQISPREVKSVSVLKGSDAAIYGSRGANGVILIDLIKAEDQRKSK